MHVRCQKEEIAQCVFQLAKELVYAFRDSQALRVAKCSFHLDRLEELRKPRTLLIMQRGDVMFLLNDSPYPFCSL